MKFVKQAWLGLALIVAASTAFAQAQQFIPILQLSRRTLCGGWFRLLRRRHRLFQPDQSRRRHQRRQIDLGGMRNGIQRGARRRMLRAPQDQERRRDRPIEPLSTGIAYGLFERVAQDKIPMTTFGYGSGDSADGRVFEWVFPVGTTYWDQTAAMIAYLGRQGRQRQQAQGQEDRVSLPRIGVRQGSDSCARSAGHQARLRTLEDTGYAAGQHAGIAVAADSSGQAGLHHPVGLRRDEPVAIKTAAKIGFPRDKMLGVWWAGSEEDVIPAGTRPRGTSAQRSLRPAPASR